MSVRVFPFERGIWSAVPVLFPFQTILTLPLKSSNKNIETVVDIRSKGSHPCKCLQLLDETSSLILPGCTAVSCLQLSDCMFVLASKYRFLERQLPDIGALLVRQIRQAIDVAIVNLYSLISRLCCHCKRNSPIPRLCYHCKRQLSDIKALLPL